MTRDLRSPTSARRDSTERSMFGRHVCRSSTAGCISESLALIDDTATARSASNLDCSSIAATFPFLVRMIEGNLPARVMGNGRKNWWYVVMALIPDCYDPSTIQPDLIQLWFKYFRVLGVGEREKRGSKRKEIASANHILHTLHLNRASSYVDRRTASASFTCNVGWASLDACSSW